MPLDEYRVGVVIAARNAQSTISRAIKSIAKNNRYPIHLIVVTDDTRKKNQNSTGNVAKYIAESFSIPYTIESTSKSNGPGWQRIQGIELARNVGCTHVTFLDADDTLSPGAIDKCMDCCILTGADIVQMKLVYRLTKLAIPFEKESRYDKTRLLEAVFEDERIFPIQNCAKLYTMNVLQFCKPITFNERILWGEDRLLNLPIFFSNPHVELCLSAVYNYYWGGTTTKRATSGDLKAYARVRDLKRKFAIEHNLVKYLPGIEDEYNQLRLYHIKRLIDQGDYAAALQIGTKDEISSIRYSLKRILKKYLKKLL